MTNEQKTANGAVEVVDAGGIPSGALAYLRDFSIAEGYGSSKPACVRFAVVSAAKALGYEPEAPVPA